MKEEKKIDNTLFITTVAGVILLIMAIAGTFFSVNHSLRVESLLLVCVPGSSSLLLLTKAIKKDKQRIKHAY